MGFLQRLYQAELNELGFCDEQDCSRERSPKLYRQNAMAGLNKMANQDRVDEAQA
jgi:hypothetical protein